jgi:RNA polymerase sigma-70 factor, ECF subfamily
MSPDETKLLSLAIAGEEKAIEQLLQKHYDDVRRHINLNVGQGLRSFVDPDELANETMIHAIQSIHQYKILPGSTFLTWLKGIANNRIREAARKAGRTPLAGIEGLSPEDEQSIRNLVELIAADQSSPSRRAGRAELKTALQSAIAHLESSDQRRAITLRYLDGNEVDEVARLMNCSEAAVRGLIHRAKDGLEELLGGKSKWYYS